MKQKYTISARELVDRPIIRDDMGEEWLNKMTDEEIKQWDEEAYAACSEKTSSGKVDAYTTKHIDRTILYNLFKMGDPI